MLPLQTFKTVVASTPLISIDLIVKNQLGEVLLGNRTNRPAQGNWFVPGRRVLKDELGLNNASSSFKGVYQHFYDDNFSEDDFTTHYVVLAYEVVLTHSIDVLPLEQHSEYQWLPESELLESESVHKHTKWYFMDDSEISLPR